MKLVQMFKKYYYFIFFSTQDNSRSRRLDRKQTINLTIMGHSHSHIPNDVGEEDILDWLMAEEEHEQSQLMMKMESKEWWEAEHRIEQDEADCHHEYTHITHLNDDCLRAIFAYLPSVDLLSLESVHERFRGIAVELYNSRVASVPQIALETWTDFCYPCTPAALYYSFLLERNRELFLFFQRGYDVVMDAE